MWKHGSTDGEVWADIGLTLPVIRFLLARVESLTRARDEARNGTEKATKENIARGQLYRGEHDIDCQNTIGHLGETCLSHAWRGVHQLKECAAAAEARLAALEAALKKYGKHNVGCNARKWPIGSLAEQDAKCSCGFTEVGAALASPTEK